MREAIDLRFKERTGAAARENEPPLGTVTAADVEAWIGIAQPGDRLCYNAGWGLPKRAPGVLAVDELIESGEVLPFQTRRTDGKGSNYWIQRRAEIDASATLLSSAAIAGDGEGEAVADQLMVILRRCARFDRRCPTDREIAEQLDLKNSDASNYQIRKLRSAGRIDIVTVQSGEHAGWRVVTITASGARTAGVPS